MDHRLPLDSAESGQWAGSVTVRLAFSDDGAALHRLAQLDSATSPTGATLVAEAQGELVAAVPVKGGRAIADPFRPTVEVVRLLELRAAQLSGDRSGRVRRFLGRRSERGGPVGTERNRGWPSGERDASVLRARTAE
jgi:hypothetical protein